MQPLREHPVTATVGLGANLGDAPATLAWAVEQVAAYPGTQLLRRSSLYRSAPVDAVGPDFYNAVIQIDTRLPPLALLDLLLKTELHAGRLRPWRNAPRTLDLDLLLYGSARMDGPVLTVPHPRLHERAFVLRPLAELDAAWLAAAQLPPVVAQRIERACHPLWNPAACAA